MEWLFIITLHLDTLFPPAIILKISKMRLLLTFSTVFFSDQFLRTHMPLSELVFKGEFVVVEGDFLPQGAVQIGSLIHVQKSRFYQHKLDLIFSGSSLATKYLHNEVFLLEG